MKTFFKMFLEICANPFQLVQSLKSIKNFLYASRLAKYTYQISEKYTDEKNNPAFVVAITAIFF